MKNNNRSTDSPVRIGKRNSLIKGFQATVSEIPSVEEDFLRVRKERLEIAKMRKKLEKKARKKLQKQLASAELSTKMKLVKIMKINDCEMKCNDIILEYINDEISYPLEIILNNQEKILKSRRANRIVV